tara:strand:+ start:2096 stop:2560 length:465 start_codon:yes stop_codon:yes gene_type:complete
MSTQIAQIASLLNTRQEVINASRAELKADYENENNSLSSKYDEAFQDSKESFEEDNQDRKDVNEGEVSYLASEFAEMYNRALTLVEVEEKDIESSILEASNLLSLENANLAAEITAAVKAIDDADAAAREKFGFTEIDAAIATIENALSGSSFA